MTYDQLEALFQPQGTGQVYYSPGAPAGTFPVGAKPITEAPPEIQFRYQQQLRSRPIGDISPIIMTDYTKSRMTLGPTTYTRAQQNEGLLPTVGRHGYKGGSYRPPTNPEGMQDYELNQTPHPMVKANPAMAATMAAATPVTGATTRRASTGTIDPLLTPAEKLAKFQRAVSPQLPMTAEERTYKATLDQEIGQAEQDRMESAAKFFDDALMKGDIRQDEGKGLTMRQKRLVTDPATGQQSQVEDYHELPVATKQMLLELVKRGVRKPEDYGMKPFVAQQTATVPAAAERLDYNANLQPNRGLIGSAMEAVSSPEMVRARDASIFGQRGLPASIGNLLTGSTLSNFVGSTVDSLGRTLVGDRYSSEMRGPLSGVLNPLAPFLPGMGLTPEIPQFGAPAAPGGTYLSPAEIAAILARQP